MRLTRVSVRDVPPIRRFDADELSSIVVLAGPNGVGKTRLKQAILDHLQKPTASDHVSLGLAATTPEEISDWGGRALDTSKGSDASKLQTTLQKSRRRTRWLSSVINFESDRSIQKVTPLKFTWDVGDPWEEDVQWNVGFGGLRARFDDTLHSIFRKVQSQRDRIAKRAEDLIREGKTSMDLNFRDQLAPFKKAFGQLLAPKELLSADPKRHHLDYAYEGQQLPVTSLGSGEQEVVNIVFDFILRNPSHSIILFDEPELHLHPELSFKLLRALETIGEQNQFIFCTHSPDIISASLEHSVIFIGPQKGDDANQAIPVSEQDETNQALRLLGQSVGIIALARRIVLIEGENASLDKQVYGSIVRNRFPNLVLVPSGGRRTLTSFATISEQVLKRTIWGVDFFMLCDGDSAPLHASPAESGDPVESRLRVLPRYHLENYFLDEVLLARVFSQMESEGDWLTKPEMIGDRLRKIASEMISYAVALYVTSLLRRQVGSVDLMPQGCHARSLDELQTLLQRKAAEELRRIGAAISERQLTRAIEERFRQLEQSLATDGEEWKRLIPGRPVLSVFANTAGLSVGRLKALYLREAEKDTFKVFEDSVAIFEYFSRLEA